MVVLVTGAREWTDRDKIERELQDVVETGWLELVVHGGCRGADELTEKACPGWGIPTKVYPAKWDEYGKKAGILRNIEMFDTEKPDLVLAFHDDLFGRSKGTLHMVQYALSQGVPVKIIP